MNGSDRLNPVIDAPLLCNSCYRTLETKVIRLVGVPEFSVTSCSGQHCPNYGEVIAFHPPKWGSQSFGEIARFTLPFTKARQREHMEFTGFKVGISGTDEVREEQR